MKTSVTHGDVCKVYSPVLAVRVLLRSLSGLISVTNFQAEVALLQRIPVDEYDVTVV